MKLIMHEEIPYFSYEMRKGKLLSQIMKVKWKVFEKNLSIPSTENAWFFLNENILMQDQMVNSKNKRWLALSTQDVLIVMKTKQPVQISVWSGH